MSEIIYTTYGPPKSVKNCPQHIQELSENFRLIKKLKRNIFPKTGGQGKIVPPVEIGLKVLPQNYLPKEGAKIFLRKNFFDQYFSKTSILAILGPKMAKKNLFLNFFAQNRFRMAQNVIQNEYLDFENFFLTWLLGKIAIFL